MYLHYDDLGGRETESPSHSIDPVGISISFPYQPSFEAGCQRKERGSDDGPGRGSTTDAPDFEKASEAA